MVKFLPASELKKKYDIFGHFYCIQLKSGKKLYCRSVLEIVGKTIISENLSEFSKCKPDAIFIMMNPGSSKPLKEVNNVILQSSISKLSVSLVPTKPDTTQYQVMRIMNYRNWGHVRVINLSDLRNPKSGDFIKCFKYIEEKYKYEIHSIFSEDRKNELMYKLCKGNDIPIICAWGVNPELDSLIKRCLAKIKGVASIQGILKNNTKDKYFHPLPTLQKAQKQWVSNMLELLHFKGAPKGRNGR